MTRKIHIRGNKPNDFDGTSYAACALQSTGLGKCRPNSRGTYRFMASEIVSYADFKKVPAEQRCAHCMVRGLEIKNRYRKAKGQPLASHLFETLAKEPS